MEFKVIDPMTLYVLIGGVLVIFVGLGLRQLETLQKTVPLWLWSGLAGVLIGAGAAAFAMYRVTSLHAASPSSQQAANVAVGSPPPPMGGPLAAPTGGAGGGGGRGGGPGGGGGTGGGPGGGGPRSRRDLTSLVGKLAILTGGVHLNLDAEQKSKLVSAIEAIDKEDEMTEDAAKEHLDAINSILTSENTDTLASIDLPRAGRAGGTGGGGGAGGGPGGAARPGGGAGPGAGSGRPVSPVGAVGSSAGTGGASGGPSSNENPFKQEDNAKRLKSLREHIATP